MDDFRNENAYEICVYGFLLLRQDLPAIELQQQKAKGGP